MKVDFPKIGLKSKTAIMDLPFSKSMLNRLMMLYAYNEIPFDLDVSNESNDVVLLHKALFQKPEFINFEDAGTPLRFFICYAAFNNLNLRIDGDARLKERPIKPLLTALESLGATFEFEKEKYSLPLSVLNSLDVNSDFVKIDTGVSSQFLSSILLAAPRFVNGLTIELDGETVSNSYVDMTLKMMIEFGFDVKKANHLIKVNPLKFDLKKPVFIERDWSSACFVLAWMCNMEKVEIFFSGLTLNSIQGDAKLYAFFELFGLTFEQQEEGLKVSRNKIKCPEIIDFDFNDTPDAFPVVYSLCALNKIPAVFKGIKNLKHKESDRVSAMIENTVQTACKVQFDGEDSMSLNYVKLENQVENYVFNSYNDHRIAMAVSLFAFEKNIEIDEMNCVKKSFPQYQLLFERFFYSNV